MGLTKNSVGMAAFDDSLRINKREGENVIALAGNPNVGKSTVFNGLTGMNQHTGNWPGKTVASAVGRCNVGEKSYLFVDIPGTYSLMAHSAEEEIARDFICFGEPDTVAVVCDATCLERNMNLVLQIMETGRRVVVCVNLLDEAKRKKIDVDLELLEKRLGVPVVGLVARKKKSLWSLLDAIERCNGDAKRYKVVYNETVENALNIVVPELKDRLCTVIDARWVALRLLDGDDQLMVGLSEFVGEDLNKCEEIRLALEKADQYLREHGFWGETLKESIVSSIVSGADEICAGAVVYNNEGYSSKDRRVDRILTGRVVGYPLMLALLAFVFWLTITGANYVSSALAGLLLVAEKGIDALFSCFDAPAWLYGIIVDGIWRVLSWVVSVMLPPMAIFFPLFTLLEDLGYLPRVAYNLDKPFCRCNACGKQALTMCMGFGCNAAGVVGCRIIDSPRERSLAVITNCFVPCNGKFPMLISLITVFIVGGGTGVGATLISSLALTCIILLGVLLTFFSTWLLSKTLLRGVPSSFTLELPPYRRPQVGKVIIRSIFDRTVFVLGRAALVAAPAGALIWIMANVTMGDTSLLSHCADFLDPFARVFGLDGVILIAFILGSTANEIVVPIIVMTYMAEGSIAQVSDLLAMKEIFAENGWTVVTAVCVILFSLCHWPCTTTLMTVKKETGSIKQTLLAAILPTVVGFVLCFAVANIARFLHYYI